MLASPHLVTAFYFYPRPPRGGRPAHPPPQWSGRAISIHALREEGDQRGPGRAPQGTGISIHALREEGDNIQDAAFDMPCLFLSTPSARRATEQCLLVLDGLDISIHALREEGDDQQADRGQQGAGFLSTPSARRATYALQFLVVRVDISIHALREEGDRAVSARPRWT